MGRLETNKRDKEEKLYRKEFQLFVDKGVVKTTVSDIVKAAGLAKGTFYLYFKDKYDLRDRLIVRVSLQVLHRAQHNLEKNPVEGFENQLLCITDFILDYLMKNKMLLRFINKNLSWGIFRQAFQESDQGSVTGVYNHFLDLMQQEHIDCANPELMIYTILEMVSSTSYSCILEQNPVPLQEYLPWLHRCIHEIIQAFQQPVEPAAVTML